MSIENDEEVAAVQISFTHPDTGKLISAQGSAVKLYSTDEDMDIAAQEFLNSETLPIVTNDIYLALSKNEKDWEIVTDNNFMYALIYGANQELSIEVVAENERKQQETKDYISEQIALEDFLVEFDEDINGAVLRNVSIKNKGTMDINGLTARLDFLSGDGSITESREVAIIDIMDQKIKAGYSWKMAEDDSFEIKNLSEETDSNKVNVYVTSVELAVSDNVGSVNSAELDYINEALELVGYKVGIFESYSGSGPGLGELEIKNHGNRDIQELTVTVYFQDYEGRNIAEDSFMVIGSLFGYSTLKANYSWKMDRDEFYPMENLASEVDITKHTVAITDISFE